MNDIFNMDYRAMAYSQMRGLQIRTDANLVEPYEDWSRCRSLPRARRRPARGIRTAMRVRHRPQRKAYEINGIFYMHPEMLRALQFKLKTRADKRLMDTLTHGELAAILMEMGFGAPAAG